MGTVYLRRRYRVSAEAEEELVAELWLQGTLGLQTLDGAGGEVEVDAWFEAGRPPHPDPGPAPGRARLVSQEEVPAADWLAAYRRHAAPFAVGERFAVDPGEPGERVPDPPPGRWLLRLPARSAFGTGSHESTRLALALLEARPPDGCSVLDVGTGTGILAFAALLLGARRAVAFDVDPAAALVAAQNSVLNRGLLPRRRPAFFTGEVAALAPGRRFDLALVNVQPEEVAGALPEVAGRLAPGGELILSGLLEAQAPPVLSRLADLGLAPRQERRDGEWIAFRLR